jgi:hypothetical protein
MRHVRTRPHGRADGSSPDAASSETSTLRRSPSQHRWCSRSCGPTWPATRTQHSGMPRVLPRRLRVAMHRPGAPVLLDLVADVDESRDHVRGHADAGVTIVEYGDFECPLLRAGREVADRRPPRAADAGPICLAAPPARRRAPGGVAGGPRKRSRSSPRLVLADARALFAHRAELGDLDVVDLAGMNRDRFVADFDAARTAQKVSSDIESARLSAVAGLRRCSSTACGTPATTDPRRCRLRCVGRSSY